MPQSPLIEGEECHHISWRRNSPKLQSEHCDYIISRGQEFFILHIMYHFTISQKFCNRLSISSPLFIFDVTCPHFHPLQIPFLGERTLPPGWKDRTKKKSRSSETPQNRFTFWVLVSWRHAPSPSWWRPANNVNKVPVWIKPSTSRSLIVVLRTHLKYKKDHCCQKAALIPVLLGLLQTVAEVWQRLNFLSQICSRISWSVGRLVGWSVSRWWPC